MRTDHTDEHKLLASRVSDYLRLAERGELASGSFLTPEEARYVTLVLQEKRAATKGVLFGGYEDAERRRLFVLPDYLSDMDGEPYDKLREYFPDELSSAVKAIRIKGSGFRELSHRDYLGALLALGIERCSMGDIVVEGKHSAIVFCTDKMFDFLMVGIDRIGADKVTVEEFCPAPDFSPTRESMPIRDTVASNRLDCVVGALTNLSREKAQTLIKSGLCEVDYLAEQRVDFELKHLPCTLTLRGYGKYRVISFDGETKRGRLRLVAEKYV